MGLCGGFFTVYALDKTISQKTGHEYVNDIVQLLIWPDAIAPISLVS